MVACSWLSLHPELASLRTRPMVLIKKMAFDQDFGQKILVFLSKKSKFPLSLLLIILNQNICVGLFLSWGGGWFFYKKLETF